ncbi:MAG: tetratricopeptide repeat protein [Flammeovirgaceae bacterium]
MAFVKYLLDKKQFDEAIIVMDQKLALAARKSEIDTLNFFLGKTYYHLQNLPKANEYLGRVSEANPQWFQESVFLSSFNSAYSGNYEDAEEKVSSYTNVKSPYPFLKTFHLAGLSLLRKDLNRFDSLALGFSNASAAVRKQQENFFLYRADLSKLISKSPLKAGFLSAIVPGLGRIYVGKRATGIYSMIVAALLGLQAYEGLQKDGANSTRFIFYSSLFTAFYIANIWGSTLSVKIMQNERQEAIRQQILFDLHIPLRTLFQ